MAVDIVVGTVVDIAVGTAVDIAAGTAVGTVVDTAADIAVDIVAAVVVVAVAVSNRWKQRLCFRSFVQSSYFSFILHLIIRLILFSE